MPNTLPGQGPADTDPRALLEQGLAASAADQAAQAMHLFERAAAAAPGWALPHFLLGSEHAALGEMDKAEAAMANAVLLDPVLHIARYQLGLMQFSSGRVGPALVTWQPLASGGLQEPGLSAFVRGFAALAQDDIDAARQLFGAGLSEPGTNPAVAGDVRKVLAGLDDAVGPTTPAQAEPHAAHVLVATYDKYKLH